MKTLGTFIWVLSAVPFIVIGFIAGWAYRSCIAGFGMAEFFFTPGKTGVGAAKEFYAEFKKKYSSP